MRQIEKEMVSAIRAGRDWHKSNTEVRISYDGSVAWVSLFGRNIATVKPGSCEPITWNCRGWVTMTTRSRLRALGFNVRIKNGEMIEE